MHKVFVFVLLSMTIMFVGAEEVKPVFHATFEHDFRAVTSAGVIAGKHSQDLNMESLSTLIQKGVVGNAAKVGIDLVNGKANGNLIHYPVDMLKAESGTLAFWLKPLDWDFQDAKFHIFCEAKGPESWMTVYKYGGHHSLSFLYGKQNNGTYVLATVPRDKWERGEFRHVAATWDKTHIRVYIDGILRATTKIREDAVPTKFELLTVGPFSAKAWKNPEGDAIIAGNSLIDDFRVYDRTLSGSEIEELFASYGVKEIDKSSIPVKITRMKMLATPDGKALNFDFTMSRSALTRKGFPVEMEVLMDGRSVMKKTLNSPSVEYRHVFDLGELKDGDYQICLNPVRENADDKIENRTFRFVIGDAAPVVDHSVPKPWNPVVFQDGELVSLMSRAVLGKSLLPEQIISEKTPLLHSSMRFVINDNEVNGEAVVNSVEKHPDLWVLDSAVNGNGFKIKSRCRYEFDGMMWFEVTLTPNGPIAVKNAKIEVPLRSDTSTLYNCFARDYFNFQGYRAGALKESVKCNHYEMDNGRLPVLWMGNEERGLYYFTQDQAGRRLKNRDETVRLEPSSEGALFTINLIDYESMLTEPVTWSFGLQVTPSRPFVRRRTLIRLGSYIRPGIALVSWFPWEKKHNVPDATFKKDDYDGQRDARTASGKFPVCHYFAGFSTSPENPWYPVHAHDWSITPPAVGTVASPDNPEWGYVYVCANSTSYRDTYLRNFEKCVRDLQMDNLYFDNHLSYYCTNEKHGCGWHDEHGKLYPTSNVLGNRELAKGCYRISKKLYPDGLILRHLTQTPEAPLISFADCGVDGESFIMNVGRDEHYYNIFRPDFFRASFMGVQFGVPDAFIPQFERAYGLHFPEKLKVAKEGRLKDQRLHIRHFMGYFFVHDADIYACYGVDPRPFWKLMDLVGVGSETPFYGYWNPLNPVKKASPADERVMASSYACRDGFLSVLMNDTDAPVTVKLAHDEKSLGQSPTVTDLENDQAVDVNALTLPARDFRMILFIKN